MAQEEYLRGGRDSIERGKGWAKSLGGNGGRRRPGRTLELGDDEADTSLSLRSQSTMARNTDVSAHIGKLSRSAVFSKKGLYKRKHAAPAAAAAPAAETKTVTIGGKANGTTRVVPTTPAPAFYPSEDVKAPKASRKTLRPTKLRSTITPGTVLILLAGRFRGKRVVFLKQLEGSGLLLVTGPFKVNGVPLRRVNQAYVIATSTKVDIASLSVRAFFSVPGRPAQTADSSLLAGRRQVQRRLLLQGQVVVPQRNRGRVLQGFRREGREEGVPRVQGGGPEDGRQGGARCDRADPQPQQVPRSDVRIEQGPAPPSPQVLNGHERVRRNRRTGGVGGNGEEVEKMARKEEDNHTLFGTR